LELLTAPTEVEREALLTGNQFVFDFTNASSGITKSSGGRTVAATRTNFPAIIGHGVAMTVGFIEPCGINLPHTHPRATEINFIVSGSFQAGFFQENGARFIGNILQPGMATVFPQGAIHFELNLGCEPAVFVAAFNNEDPGVQTIAQSFFGLPTDVTQVSLNISSIQTVEDLAAHLPANPAVAMQECMKTCGL
jgi:oxalate decarboxylase/phosphoglucose isomerase-like protein (cupin superfamily)